MAEIIADNLGFSMMTTVLFMHVIGKKHHKNEIILCEFLIIWILRLFS